MTHSEEEQVLGELITRARGKRNGQMAGIVARIRKFEQRYEMSSAELVRRLKANEIRETAEISEWLFLLRARDRSMSG